MADQKIPPASFPMLIQMLGTQAMVALGHIADPATKQTMQNLDLAKHTIDTIDILAAKTKGNLTPDEATVLETVAHELRMAYLAAKK